MVGNQSQEPIRPDLPSQKTQLGKGKAHIIQGQMSLKRQDFPTGQDSGGSPGEQGIDQHYRVTNHCIP